jgi:trigger factor
LSEEEVDRFFDRLRNTYATIEPADRPAQEGDLVSVTVSGRLTHPAEGEDAEVIKDSPAQALVRQPEEQPGSEWPFPGFGMQLIGLSASDEKKTTFTYAEDADYETLRGKEVEFTAKVDSVKKYTLPELNDEFAQTVGEYASLEEMRKSIRARLEENAREDYDKDYFNQLMDKIGEQAVVKYPPQILDDEIEEVLHSVEHNLSHQNLDVETYLKMRQLERDKFIEDEIKPVAKSRLQRSLIMDEVARHEKIEVKDDEVQQEFQQTLAELQNSGELKESQRKVGPERLANAIAVEAFSRLMNRRVLEQLKSIATGQAEAAAQAQATPAEKATETVEGDPASEPKAKPARKRAKKATETTTKEE